MTKLLYSLIAALILLAQPMGAQTLCGNNAPCTTLSKYDSAASTNATPVTAAPTGLVNIIVINTTTTLYYLKLYDKASTPTCNSDTVKQKIPIPFGASNAGGGYQMTRHIPAHFPTGLAFCLTGGLADNDNTSAATGVTINLEYYLYR